MKSSLSDHRATHELPLEKSKLKICFKNQSKKDLPVTKTVLRGASVWLKNFSAVSFYATCVKVAQSLYSESDP